MAFEFSMDPRGYRVLTNQGIEDIHHATMKLMENYGVRIFGKEAQCYLREAGCHVNENTCMVQFPCSLVEWAIKTTPGHFTMYGRNPKDDFVMGGGAVAFTSFGTGVEIFDIDTGERQSTTTNDLCEVTRFVDAIPEINAFTTAVAAQDVPGRIKDFIEAEAIFNNTTKHSLLDAENGYNAKKIIEMGSIIAGGHDKLRERPFFTLCMCPNSPLEIHEGPGEVIIETCKAGIPISILSMGLAGGTTPATLAGTFVTTNAEILAGIVLAQLVNPGNPVIYGSSTTIMDMRLATTPVGAPEHGLYGAAVAQVGDYYDIPTKVGGT
jgi:trimethylamine---corrinoid protein Co-methyltransferase